MSEEERLAEEAKFWGEIREALLALVDIIERKMQMPVRTSEIRKQYKETLRQKRLAQQSQ